MGIDWFTLVAQVVNFLILIGLLWHFAYKPIIRAMDDRESSIRDRLKEAEQKRAEADEKARELDEEREKLEARREELLSEARDKAEARRKELIAEARERVERSEAEWHDNLRRQKDDLADEVRRRAGRHVVTAARRLLHDMADAELERRLVSVFEKRLGQIDEETTESLRQAVGEADGRVKFVTAFELPEDDRKQLRERLGELVEADVDPEFETDGALLCGIELRAGDRRVAWSANEYLAELHDRIDATISSVARRKPGEREQAGDEKGDDGE